MHSWFMHFGFTFWIFFGWVCSRGAVLVDLLRFVAKILHQQTAENNPKGINLRSMHTGQYLFSKRGIKMPISFLFHFFFASVKPKVKLRKAWFVDMIVSSMCEFICPQHCVLYYIYIYPYNCQICLFCQVHAWRACLCVLFVCRLFCVLQGKPYSAFFRCFWWFITFMLFFLYDIFSLQILPLTS